MYNIIAPIIIAIALYFLNGNIYLYIGIVAIHLTYELSKNKSNKLFLYSLISSVIGYLLLKLL